MKNLAPIPERLFSRYRAVDMCAVRHAWFFALRCLVPERDGFRNLAFPGFRPELLAREGSRLRNVGMKHRLERCRKANRRYSGHLRFLQCRRESNKLSSTEPVLDAPDLIEKTSSLPGVGAQLIRGLADSGRKLRNEAVAAPSKNLMSDAAGLQWPYPLSRGLKELPLCIAPL